MKYKYSIATKMQVITLIPLVSLVFLLLFLAKNYMYNSIIQERISTLESVMDLALSSIDYNQALVKENKITLEEAKSRSAEEIGRLLYGKDKDDYIWVNDFQHVIISHPKRELVGQSMVNFEDKKGTFIFREFVKIAKENGSGFYQYFWNDKKDPTIFVPKLSYVRVYPDWNWVLGTGIYIHDVESSINAIILKSVGVIVVLVAIVAFVILLTSRKIVLRPLTKLSGAMRAQLQALASSSEQISETGKYLKHGSKEQRENLDNVIYQIDEIKSAVNANAERAQESSQFSDRSVHMSNDGLGLGEDLKKSFNKIKEDNVVITNEMKENEVRFSKITTIISEISEKTNIINDIVFQTKLLAFNASVEAARAGEHGKGFAVVAEEVGNLASVSGTAANEISDMLNSSIEEVNRIVEETTTKVNQLIANTSVTISDGEVKVDECLNQFKDINENIENVGAMIQEIAKFSSDQTVGINEIMLSVKELEKSVDQSVLLASQTQKVADLVENENTTLEENIKSLNDFVFGDHIIEEQKLSPFIWSDDYILNIDKIDDDHQEIVRLINILIDNINEGEVPAMSKAFDELISFAKQHFDEEEDFFKSFDYPQFEAHARVHERLIAQLRAHRSSIDTGEFNASKVVIFVQKWLLSHIMGIDNDYATYYKQNIQQDKMIA